MQGLVITNGYFSNESTINQVERLTEEFNKLGVLLTKKKGNEVITYIENGVVKSNIGKVDFVIFLDKNIHVAKMLEKAGYRVFNSANAIELCDDKMITYIFLANKNIAMPKTLPSPIMYKSTDDDKFILEVEKELSYPIVVKNVYGSMGREVYLAKNKKELKDLFDKLKLYPHLYQEYIGDGLGKDIRVIVVGGKVISSMQRENENDFRSNIGLGGKGKLISLSKEQESLALNAVKALGLDYAGVDIISKNQKDYICEVNSNAFFKEIEDISGKNVAGAYAKHVFNAVYNK
ncbi:MAG: RimK family alpha-L-glutamate ligase [Clostridiales bacterium]|nr:RimK family alpha-L-glutamate ligase [Clostridiales bacterium]